MLPLCEERINAFNCGTSVSLGRTFSVPSPRGQVVLSPAPLSCCPLCSLHLLVLPCAGRCQLVPAEHPPERARRSQGSKQACGSDCLLKQENSPRCSHGAGKKFPVWKQQRKPLSPLHEAGNIHPAALSPWGTSAGPRVVRGHLGSRTARTRAFNLKLSFLDIISCVKT